MCVISKSTEKLIFGLITIWGVYLVHDTLDLKRELQKLTDNFHEDNLFHYREVPLQPRGEGPFKYYIDEELEPILKVNSYKICYDS